MAEPSAPIDESQTRLDEVVTAWDAVKARAVFGHRGYLRGRKMFAFLAEGGAGVRITSAMDADAILGRKGVVPFAYNDMPMKGWAVLPLRSDAELDAALDLVRQAYETVGG